MFRYVPSPEEGQAGEGVALGVPQNLLESRDPLVLDYGDNLTVSPQGHLIVCEDKSGPHINHLKMITPTGKSFTLARNAHKESAEFAGVCHSPDGGPRSEERRVGKGCVSRCRNRGRRVH